MHACIIIIIVKGEFLRMQAWEGRKGDWGGLLSLHAFPSRDLYKKINWCLLWYVHRLVNLGATQGAKSMSGFELQDLWFHPKHANLQINSLALTCTNINLLKNSPLQNYKIKYQ